MLFDLHWELLDKCSNAVPWNALTHKLFHRGYNEWTLAEIDWEPGCHTILNTWGLRTAEDNRYEDITGRGEIKGLSLISHKSRWQNYITYHCKMCGVCLHQLGHKDTDNDFAKIHFHFHASVVIASFSPFVKCLSCSIIMQSLLLCGNYLSLWAAAHPLLVALFSNEIVVVDLC